MKKDNLLVIADDLTGANDTGVMFAEAGFNTRLEINLNSLDMTDFSKADVFSVSTDSRPLGIEAKSRTEQTVLTGIKKGIGRIYLKVDSTMRGSVQYQIAGALDAWMTLYPDAKAIICPAYPEMGRTIENGHLYVNGIPVNETASGKDVICPVHSSLMQDLLPESINLPCLPEEELIGKILAAPQRQIIIDAKNTSDLDVIADVIERLGNKVIPVGSAGLAQKLKFSGVLNHHRPDKGVLELERALIVVTSVHETSQTQIDQYISSAGGQSIVFNPSPSQLVNHRISALALKQQLGALMNSGNNHVIIRANPAKVVNMRENINNVARTIAEYLAELGKYALDNQKFDTLILFGGDGAGALLERMKVSEMRVLYAVVPGVPLCLIDNGKYAGMKVMTKSGGFGNQMLLHHIMTM